MQQIRSSLPTVLYGVALEKLQEVTTVLQEQGVTTDLAVEVAGMSYMFPALDIAEAASSNDMDILEFSKVYFLVGNKLSLGWFREKVKDQAIRDHWDALARAAFRDDVDRQQRSIAISILRFKSGENVTAEELVESWMQRYEPLLSRWQYFVKELHVGAVEFTMFAVAIRELLDIAQIAAVNCDTDGGLGCSVETNVA